MNELNLAWQGIGMTTTIGVTMTHLATTLAQALVFLAGPDEFDFTVPIPLGVRYVVADVGSSVDGAFYDNLVSLQLGLVHGTNLAPRPTTVVLDDVGDKKIRVIRVLREVAGLGLKEAKDLTERVGPGTPQVILSNTTEERADAAIKLLLEQGASAHHEEDGGYAPTFEEQLLLAQAAEAAVERLGSLPIPEGHHVWAVLYLF